MAVSGYQNPIEYQMYSAFENKDEDTTPVTATNITDVQPQATSLTTTTAQQPTRSSLDILQTAGMTSAQRPAAAILQGVGTPTAKDILRSVNVSKPGDFLGDEDITASGILESYRREQESFKQQQRISQIATKAESDLLKKEQEFIKNYRYDLPQYNPNRYDTKYGSVEFDPEKVMVMPELAATKDGVTDSFAFTLRNVDTKDFSGAKPPTYVFLPMSHIVQGLEGTHTKEINTAFLKKETWEYLSKYAQPIDLSSTKGLKTVNMEGQPPTMDFDKGFLLTKNDWNSLYNNYLSGNFIKSYEFTSGHYNTKTLGIAERNGELVYVKDNFVSGRTTYYNQYVGADGLARGQYFTEGKGTGIKELDSAIKTFAEIPFAPEIIGIATGNPALYASLKGLQTVGRGGDLGDWATSLVTSYVSASVSQSLGTYGESLGNSIHVATGIPEAVAMTMGSAVVNAGFNGFMAAAQGQDVGDAMLAGAIGGSISANAADITNAVFGGADNVSTLAGNLKLSVPQTQRIFAGALSSGAVNSVVKGMDFMDAFTESLLTQGISQAGANIVGSNLNSNLSTKQKNAIVSNTKIFLQATARAAVRGEDINTAIKRVAPYLQGRAIGQTINIATSK